MSSKSPRPTPEDHWIFGTGSGPNIRFERDHDKVRRIAAAVSELGLVKVLTSGTFDILHEGHAKYLEEARKLGDILIVGVDSDERTKKRKGPNRPVVGEDERVSILSHLRSVDLITLKDVDDPSGHLLEIVKPDIYVMSKSTYETEEAEQRMQQKITAAEQHCGQVVLLEPMATTGTTARIRELQLQGIDSIAQRIRELLQEELGAHGR